MPVASIAQGQSKALPRKAEPAIPPLVLRRDISLEFAASRHRGAYFLPKLKPIFHASADWRDKSNNLRRTQHGGTR